MLAINSFYQEHIWSLWTLHDLTIKSRNSPPSAVLFSLNYFRQRLVASVPPPVRLTADCWCRAVPSCLRSALSRPAAAAAAAQIFYNPSAPLLLLHRYLYPALRLLRCSAYPASAAACIQILCAAPLFCTWSTQPATHFWAATLKASSTGSLGTGSSTPQVKEGGWVVDSSFHFLNISQCTQTNKKKVVSLSIAQEYLKIACSFLQLTAVANPLKGIRPLNPLPSVSMYFPKWFSMKMTKLDELESRDRSQLACPCLSPWWKCQLIVFLQSELHDTF